MGIRQLSPIFCVVVALLIVAPEPARDSPTKLGDPASPSKPAPGKTAK
jgi:hypothetical protein